MPGERPGPEGLKQLLRGFFAAFPDLTLTVDFLVSENDMVVARVSMRGTHQGVFQGAPGSGRSFTMAGMQALRVQAAGLIVEHWANFDDLGMLRQLGLRS